MLSQYAQFVAVTREYANKYDNREEAMNAAIEYCIGHGILEDILRKHRSQVLGSLLEEFDEKKYAKTLREEGYEVGREEGYASGREEGYVSGRKEGYVSGRKEGYVSGKEEGYASGRTDGLSEGEREGSFSMLAELVNDGTITIQKAAEKAGMDEAAFKKKMNEQ